MDSITFWRVDPLQCEGDKRYIIKLKHDGSFQVAHFEVCKGEDGEDDERYFVPLETPWFNYILEEDIEAIYEFPYKGE
jgi:hypothetical protein